MLKTKTKGFTIVELLIVIVVVAILAAISIVAYNGIQARARDNIRYSDVKAIMKALELYKADKGSYPIQYSVGDTTNAAICASHTNGYSYSDATDSTWLQSLVAGKYLSKVPTPPNNGCTSYYRYLRPGPTDYNCPSRTSGYYVLEVAGADGAMFPSDASSTSSSVWRPCAGATAAWGGDSKTWAFVKDDV